MAHFWGSIQGNRGEASRCGSKSSGLRTRINGWSLGIAATIYHETLGDNPGDRVSVTLTSGSAGDGLGHGIGCFSREDLDDLKAGRATLRIVRPGGSND